MKNFFHPHLPALSENRVLRYFSFSALYFAQGIPDGILYFGFPAWMAMNGKTPAEIGAFVGVLIIPWSFKFVMGPFHRPVYLPAHGKKKAMGALWTDRNYSKFHRHVYHH